MSDSYLMFSLVIISICWAAIIIKIITHIENHRKPDGEMQILSENNKDIYRLVCYNDVEKLSEKKEVIFKVIDTREKQTQ